MSDQPKTDTEPTPEVKAPPALELPGGGTLPLGALNGADLSEWLEWARLRWAAQVREVVKAAHAAGGLTDAEASAAITAAFLRLPLVNRESPEADGLARSEEGGRRLLWLACRRAGYAGTFAEFVKLLTV